jgi:hypothetical protein
MHADHTERHLSASPPRSPPRSPWRAHAPAPAAPDATRERAAHLAQSAGAVIDRILSGDSRAFLEANRQTGGE